MKKRNNKENGLKPCPHCGEMFDDLELAVHITGCKKNPENKNVGDKSEDADQKKDTELTFEIVEQSVDKLIQESSVEVDYNSSDVFMPVYNEDRGEKASFYFQQEGKVYKVEISTDQIFGAPEDNDRTVELHTERHKIIMDILQKQGHNVVESTSDYGKKVLNSISEKKKRKKKKKQSKKVIEPTDTEDEIDVDKIFTGGEKKDDREVKPEDIEKKAVEKESNILAETESATGEVEKFTNEHEDDISPDTEEDLQSNTITIKDLGNKALEKLKNIRKSIFGSKDSGESTPEVPEQSENKSPKKHSKGRMLGIAAMNGLYKTAGKVFGFKIFTDIGLAMAKKGDLYEYGKGKKTEIKERKQINEAMIDLLNTYTNRETPAEVGSGTHKAEVKAIFEDKGSRGTPGEEYNLNGRRYKILGKTTKKEVSGKRLTITLDKGVDYIVEDIGPVQIDKEVEEKKEEQPKVEKVNPVMSKIKNLEDQLFNATLAEKGPEAQDILDQVDKRYLLTLVSETEKEGKSTDQVLELARTKCDELPDSNPIKEKVVQARDRAIKKIANKEHRDRLAAILREYRNNQEGNEKQRDEKIKETSKLYLRKKVNGLEIAQDALNAVLIGADIIGGRAILYAVTSAMKRGVETGVKYGKENWHANQEEYDKLMKDYNSYLNKQSFINDVEESLTTKNGISDEYSYQTRKEFIANFDKLESGKLDITTFSADKGKLKYMASDMTVGAAWETTRALAFQGKTKEDKEKGKLVRILQAGAAFGSLLRLYGIGTQGLEAAIGDGDETRLVKEMTEAWGEFKGKFEAGDAEGILKAGFVDNPIDNFKDIAHRFSNPEDTINRIWESIKAKFSGGPDVAPEIVATKIPDIDTKVEGSDETLTIEDPDSVLTKQVPDSLLNKQTQDITNVDEDLLKKIEGQDDLTKKIEGDEVLTKSVEGSGTDNAEDLQYKELEEKYGYKKGEPISQDIIKKIEASDDAKAVLGQLSKDGLINTFKYPDGTIEHFPADSHFEDVVDSSEVKGSDSIWRSGDSILRTNAEKLGFEGDVNNKAELDKWVNKELARMVADLADGDGNIKDLVHNNDVVAIDLGADGKLHLELLETSGIEAGYLSDENVYGSDMVKPMEGLKMAEGMEFSKVTSDLGDVGAEVQIGDGKSIQIWDWDRDGNPDVIMPDGTSREMSVEQLNDYLTEQGVYEEIETDSDDLHDLEDRLVSDRENMTTQEIALLNQIKNFNGENDLTGVYAEDAKGKAAEYILDQVKNNPELLDRYPSVKEAVGDIHADSLNTELHESSFLGLGDGSDHEELYKYTVDLCQNRGLSDNISKLFTESLRLNSGESSLNSDAYDSFMKDGNFDQNKFDIAVRDFVADLHNNSAIGDQWEVRDLHLSENETTAGLVRKVPDGSGKYEYFLADGSGEEMSAEEFGPIVNQDLTVEPIQEVTEEVTEQEGGGEPEGEPNEIEQTEEIVDEDRNVENPPQDEQPERELEDENLTEAEQTELTSEQQLNKQINQLLKADSSNLMQGEGTDAEKKLAYLESMRDYALDLNLLTEQQINSDAQADKEEVGKVLLEIGKTFKELTQGDITSRVDEIAQDAEQLKLLTAVLDNNISALEGMDDLPEQQSQMLDSLKAFREGLPQQNTTEIIDNDGTRIVTTESREVETVDGKKITTTSENTDAILRGDTASSIYELSKSHASSLAAELKSGEIDSPEDMINKVKTLTGINDLSEIEQKSIEMSYKGFEAKPNSPFLEKKLELTLTTLLSKHSEALN